MWLRCDEGEVIKRAPDSWKKVPIGAAATAEASGETVSLGVPGTAACRYGLGFKQRRVALLPGMDPPEPQAHPAVL